MTTMQVACVGALIVTGSAIAQPIDWESLPITRHSDFQAVNADGSPAYTGGFPMRLRGVLLSTPGQVFDNTPEFVPFGGPQTFFNFGARQQPYIQTVDPADAGGTAMFLAQSLGNHPVNQDDFFSYTDSSWLDELDRVNIDPATGHRFVAGDLVEVRARVGLHFSGKFNVNEAHDNAAENDFDVLLIEAGYGLPEPEPFQIGTVIDASGADIFDLFRVSGGEALQSTRVVLTFADVVDAGAWSPGSIVEVEADGRTLPVLLGTDAGFSSPPPASLVRIVGIFDQEASPPPIGGTNGYRLIAVNPGEVFRAADFNHDGVVDILDSVGFLDGFAGGDMNADVALSAGAPGTLDADDVTRFLDTAEQQYD